MMFLSKIGNDFLLLGTIILGGLAAFFGFRNHYISKGEDRAVNRANGLTLKRIMKARQAEINFKGERGEDIHITGYGHPDDFMLSKDAISYK